MASKYKALGSLIDKYSYISAAELFLGKETSLFVPLKKSGWPDMTIGVILSRQIESLEQSRWKPEVQVALEGILQDLNSVYNETFPLHYAKFVARQMELAYYANNTDLNLGEIADKAQSVLLNSVSLWNRYIVFELMRV